MTMTDAPVSTQPSNDPGLELWRNGGRARVVVKRFGHDGKVRSELIGAGKAFHLTPTERRMNQEMTATPAQDIFTNGTLQPVRLLDGEPDTQSLLDNPNHIPDDDARKVFKLPDPQFKARIDAVTNEAALQTLLNLANERSTRATVWQMRAVEARLAAVAPAVDHIRGEAPAQGTGKDKANDSGGNRNPKAVSPR